MKNNISYHACGTPARAIGRFCDCQLWLVNWVHDDSPPRLAALRSCADDPMSDVRATKMFTSRALLGWHAPYAP